MGARGLASEALEGGVGTLHPEGPNSSFQEPSTAKDPTPRLPCCMIKMRMMRFGANDTQGASLSTDFSSYLLLFYNRVLREAAPETLGKLSYLRSLSIVLSQLWFRNTSIRLTRYILRAFS